MKPGTVEGTPSGNTRIVDNRTSRVPDFLRLLDEIKAFKNRLLSLDTARLDDEFVKQRETVMKGIDKRVNPRDPRAPDDLLKRQTEALRIVEADHERSKEILNARYQKFDANIVALIQFIQSLGPMKELESRLAEKEDRLKKQEEELTVQRKVMAHEQEEFDRERRRIEAAEEALKTRTHELETKLAHLDVVKRAEALDRLKTELDAKLQAFEQESADLPRQREEVERDRELVDRQHQEIENAQQRLRDERTELEKRRGAMADAVARELASSFESFLREMLKAPVVPQKPAAPAPAATPAATAARPRTAAPPAPATPRPASAPATSTPRPAPQPARPPDPASARSSPSADPFRPPDA